MGVKPDSRHRDVLLLGYEDEENLGLRYITAYLKKNCVSVGIIPLQDMDNDILLDTILQADPRIIGFSMIFQRMLPDFSDLISYLRLNGVKCHFTMGGHFPTIEYKKTLESIPGLDSVIRHEGELTLLELYNHVNEPDLWPQIRGLAFKKGEQVYESKPRPLIHDLDELPFPQRSNKINSFRGLGFSSIISSRGCNHDCSFCSIKEFYKNAPGLKRRSRSPENVVKEMKSLFENGTRIFIFKDDDFSMIGEPRRQWIERFVDDLEKDHLADDILWRISCRIDEVDANMLEKLMGAGLSYLYIGIESGNNQGLKTCNKNYTVETIYNTIEILERYHVNFEYGFMMLDPDSSIMSVKENISFLRRLCNTGKVVANFTKMLPYAGTSIATRLEREGRLKGSIASPDYNYIDHRVDVFETFLVRAFYRILFDPLGVSNRLQNAKYDAVVMNKFLKDECDTEFYMSEVQQLTRLSNGTILDTLQQAADFMDCRRPDEIYRDWTALGKLADQVQSKQSEIIRALDELIPDESVIFHTQSRQ